MEELRTKASLSSLRLFDGVTESIAWTCVFKLGTRPGKDCKLLLNITEHRKKQTEVSSQCPRLGMWVMHSALRGLLK